MNSQVKEAKQVIKEKYGVNKLFSHPDSNPKIVKSDKALQGYLTRIMHFAPADVSGYEVCPARSPQCTAACLHTAGNPVYLKLKNKARIGRTRFYFEHFELFKALLIHELACHVRYCEKNGVKPAVRLNGTSDIVWEKKFPELFAMFPNVVFYDYTKLPQRMMPGWGLPKNYHLTFSRSETAANHVATSKVLAAGGNVAVVFAGYGYGRVKYPFPAKYLGYNIVDGDVNDLRFLDGKGVVVGLRAKGKAYRNKPSKDGFVVSLNVLKSA